MRKGYTRVPLDDDGGGGAELVTVATEAKTPNDKAFYYLAQEYGHRRSSIGIVCQGMCYAVDDRKDGQRSVLQQITFEALPGSVTGIMGCIGSGKSTLLNCLAGHISLDKLTGTFRVFAVPSQRVVPAVVDEPQQQILLHHVPQHQAFYYNLTARETLQYAAAFRLPTWKRDQRNQWTDALLALLALTAVADTKVGDDDGAMGSSKTIKNQLSGGQRRVLAIALALVGFPSCILIDEPTSGLDATAAVHIMCILKRLAQYGCTLIVSIHQPSSSVFETLDSLVLLGKQGRQFYSGPRQLAAQKFEQTYRQARTANALRADDSELGLRHRRTESTQESSHPRVDERNPAEFLLTVLDDTSIDPCLPYEITDPTRRQDNTIELHSEQQKLQQSHWLHQAVTLMRRDLLNQFRDQRLFAGRLITYLALCMFLGLLFGTIEPLRPGRITFHYFVAATLVAFSVTRLLPLLEERAIYIQETANYYYSPLPYTVALSLTSLPYLVVIIVCCTVLLYTFVDLWQGWYNVSFFMLAYFVTLYCAESMLLFICMVMGSNGNLAVMVGIGTLSLGVVLSGFPILPSDMRPVFWALHKLSFQTYHYQAVVINDLAFRTLVHIVKTVNATTNITTSVVSVEYVGIHVLDALELSNQNAYQCLAIIGCLSLLFRLCVFVGLSCCRRSVGA
jgi:ABC-type multidrug transport system ATPase subunit